MTVRSRFVKMTIDTKKLARVFSQQFILHRAQQSPQKIIYWDKNNQSLSTDLNVLEIQSVDQSVSRIVIVARCRLLNRC